MAGSALGYGVLCAMLVLGIANTVHAERRMLSYYGGGSSGSSPSSGSSGYGGSSPSSGGSGYGSSPSSGSSGYGGSSPSSGGSGYGSSPSSGSSGYGSSSPSSGSSGYGSSSPSSGGYGTPKYWCGHPEKVPKILSLLSSIAKIFGPRILSHFHKSSGAPSLFGALKDESNDAMTSLVREGSAAFINSYAYSDKFPMSAPEVISRFNNALESPDLVAQQAIQFQQFNEAL